MRPLCLHGLARRSIGSDGMTYKDLEYDALGCGLDGLTQAAYLMPAIRGRCKPVHFPVVRFLKDPSLTESGFYKKSGNLRAAWICGRALQELHAQIAQISAGTELVGAEGIGLFACAGTVSEAQSRLNVFLGREQTEYAKAEASRGRMEGRIIIVTGGAQGLGKGIANVLLSEGARVVLADMNLPLAQETACQFRSTYGPDSAAALYADVTDDNSVARLCRDTVLQFGGIDVMFSNAGIVMSGGLEQMTSDRMKKVADVNYIGYFRCAKYASRYMKIQSAFDPRFTADLLNTSSVAGLIGYQKNFAYCGSKFAVLGLTQCFAKELLPYGIKVNSICPGNYYDGLLWNDPEKGLFVQYLKAGKIPNGKTVQDSVDYYMNREPFQRGCTPEDIAAGVLYCIEQQFETGTALPVTGGLAMGAL